MDKIKIHAPATVANLSCGFDILGLCLDEPYDEIEVHKISKKVVSLEILKSPYSDIPDNPKHNTGGLPALLIQKDLNLDFGFHIKIKKVSININFIRTNFLVYSFKSQSK